MAGSNPRHHYLLSRKTQIFKTIEMISIMILYKCFNLFFKIYVFRSYFDFEVVTIVNSIADFMIWLPTDWIEPMNRAFNEARYIDILMPFVKAGIVIAVTGTSLLASLYYLKKQFCGDLFPSRPTKYQAYAE